MQTQVARRIHAPQFIPRAVLQATLFSVVSSPTSINFFLKTA